MDSDDQRRKAQFESERVRLMDALGQLTEGGIIEFLLTDINGVWRYRREPLVLRSMERMSLMDDNGIPYLAPELVLLFKSKNTGNRERPDDQLDFENVLPHLEAERRAWLHWALVATSPDHPWIKQLT